MTPQDHRFISAVQNNDAITCSLMLKESVREVGHCRRLVRLTVAARNNSTQTMLHIACAKGNVEVVKVLLSFGAEPNKKVGKNKSSALHEAAKRGRTLVIQQLLKAGGDTAVRDRQRRTPLMYAVRSLCADSVIALINANSEINAVDYHGKTALHESVVAGDVNITRILIKHRASINHSTSGDQSLIYKAVATGDGELTRLLVNSVNNFNINKPTIRSKETPLGLAARAGYSECVEALVQAGADMNSLTRKQTALNEAINAEQESTVRTLMQLGADPYQRDSFGWDAFACCAKVPNRRQHLLQILLTEPERTKRSKHFQVVHQLNQTPNSLFHRLPRDIIYEIEHAYMSVPIKPENAGFDMLYNSPFLGPLAKRMDQTDMLVLAITFMIVFVFSCLSFINYML